MTNPVTQTPAASSKEALSHFEAVMAFETDCWDVHEAMQRPQPGFILLDVRSPKLFVKGHVPGAVNLPHGKIIRSKMAQWPHGTLFVVYCAGPHCNGATKAAIRLAGLGLSVKTMPGGITGWLDEGFTLVSEPVLEDA